MTYGEFVSQMVEDSDYVDTDELDRKILNKLLEEGRKSFRQIAEDVDSTPATVINRVERLQDEGVINGYSANIDYRRLGFQGIAAIEVIVKGDSLDEVAAELSEHNNVVTAYTITGDTDILVLVKFRRREELSRFVQQELLGTDVVEKTITHMALDILKEDADPKL